MGIRETVPATTFTAPEVASIGLSEAAANTKYGAEKITIHQQDLEHVDRAVCDAGTGQTVGKFKIVCEKKSNIVLGATIVAPTAGELIGEIAVLMETKSTFDQLATIMHPYPTYGMGLQLLAAPSYYEKILKYKFVYKLLSAVGL